MKLIALLGLILLSVSCSHLFYQPSRYKYADPAQYQLKYEDVYFHSRDGVKLHGWFFPAQGKAKGTVVHFHGNAQNLSSHFFSLVWLPAQGYNYFIFDYRGYGASEGSPTQATIHLDALSAIDKADELRKTHGGGKLVVYGQSLGSVISARAVSDYDQSKIALLVQDSPFYSYKMIAFDRLIDVWFLIPLAPLGFALVSDEYASWPVLQKIKVPTLIITGDKDEITPSRYGRTIFKHIGASQKWWWRSPDAAHINAFFVEDGKYRRQLIDLLDRP